MTDLSGPPEMSTTLPTPVTSLVSGGGGVWAIGGDRHVWCAFHRPKGVWSGWVDLGGSALDLSDPPFTDDVYALLSNNGIWARHHDSHADRWSDWYELSQLQNPWREPLPYPRSNRRPVPIHDPTYRTRVVSRDTSATVALPSRQADAVARHRGVLRPHDRVPSIVGQPYPRSCGKNGLGHLTYHALVRGSTPRRRHPCRARGSTW